MSTVIEPAETVTFPRPLLPVEWSLADVRRHVGDVPLNRIRLYPPPGMATEEDALRIHDREGRSCELIDGILVEKDMATFESLLGGILIQIFNNFLDEHPYGIVTGESGPYWILPTKMRIPDVSFIRWEKFPGKLLPADEVFRVVPDLAVEVISKGNTRREMELKLKDFRQAGVRLIWYIYPVKRTATVYGPQGDGVTLDEDGQLDGGDVLPGFSLALRELFDRFERKMRPPR